MLSHLRPAVAMIALFTLVTGLAYPLAITGIAKLAMPYQAQGSLVTHLDGRVLGSALIAQGFAKPEYLHPRGSAAGSNGYDATSSSGSNLGPMDPKLATAVSSAAAALRKENPGGVIPADAVTQSGSGLDPDISPENAAFQTPRIAKARGLPESEVAALIIRNTEQPVLGFIGQPHVNVLTVNRALDARQGLLRRITVMSRFSRPLFGAAMALALATPLISHVQTTAEAAAPAAGSGDASAPSSSTSSAAPASAAPAAASALRPM